MDVIDFLKFEHKILKESFFIRKARVELAFTNEKESPQALKAAILQFLNQCELDFESNHHAKEEAYLFAAIKDIDAVRSGGPMCAMYFDGHISWPALKTAQVFLKNHTGQLYQPEWSTLELEFIKKGLPITVPCEDHEAGHMLLRGLRDVLNSAKDVLDNQKCFIDGIELYWKIQERHFAREENCFFKMCQSLLSKEQLKAILFEMEQRYPRL